MHARCVVCCACCAAVCGVMCVMWRDVDSDGLVQSVYTTQHCIVFHINRTARLHRPYGHSSTYRLRFQPVLVVLRPPQ